MRTAVEFLALVFTTLALAPAAAHLMELPNKIHLDRGEYLIVQQIYRGWALLGVVILGALSANLALVLQSRHHRRKFIAALVALLAVVGAQVVFWVWTYPANVQTRNWTRLPDNWQALRRQWEYSHAVGSAFMLIAALAVFTAVLSGRSSPPGQRVTSRADRLP